MRPKKVLWANVLSHYEDIAQRFGTVDIHLLMKLFQKPAYDAYFQDCWDGTMCCEGVLVGKEIEREELSRLIDHYRRAV